MSNPAIDRLLEKIGDAQLLDKLNDLPATELQSLLLEVFRRSATSITPQQLLKAYETNRFVTPSAVDPITFYKTEIGMLQLAKSEGFEPLELSPLAPLGNCSAIGLADQNKIISAGRGTEVVADATNLMALEAAVRRKHTKFGKDPVNLCCVHRHVRAQAIPNIKGFTPHFKIFTAVTAGRDSGSLEFEKTALLQHLSYYKKFFVDDMDLTRSVVIIKGLKTENGNTDKSRHLYEFVKSRLDGFQLSFEEVPEDKHRYYQHTRFSLNIDFNGREFNIGDGGFVDWGSKLTSNGKERMFTSGVGVELLVKLLTGII
ncbi:MAG TPA: hypothetical protein VFE50_05630 [Cyclobacteriaceae bacterium]|nr:hypothetical protein [Cyclobacteriaceae bacterium]